MEQSLLCTSPRVCTGSSMQRPGHLFWIEEYNPFKLVTSLGNQIKIARAEEKCTVQHGIRSRFQALSSVRAVLTFQLCLHQQPWLLEEFHC